MIPLMMIETAAKPATKDVSVPAAAQEDASTAFSDMLALVEGDAPVEGGEVQFLTAEAELSEGTPEDAILLVAQLPDAKPEVGASVELGLPARPKLTATDDAEQVPIPKEQKAKTDPLAAKENVTISDDAKAVVDLPKAKNQAQSIMRPSFAQSAVESQLPDKTPAVARQQAKPDVKVDPGPRGVENTKDQATPAIPAKPATPQTATPGAAVPAQISQGATPDAAVPIISAPTSNGIDQKPTVDRSRDSKGDRGVKIVNTPSTQTPQVIAGPPPAVAIAQSMLAERHQAFDVQRKTHDGEVPFGLTTSDRSTVITPTVPATAHATGPEMARHAATQIAVAVNSSTGKATEIALNPEELGRVRLSMTTMDGAITLHMSAERPETQDLLRRHIDVLAQEFRALGYDTISFSFGPEGQSKQQDGSPDTEGETHLEVNDPPQPQAPAQTVLSSGLDLRI